MRTLSGPTYVIQLDCFLVILAPGFGCVVNCNNITGLSKII